MLLTRDDAGVRRRQAHRHDLRQGVDAARLTLVRRGAALPLVADGVWTQSEPDAQPTFHALPEPSKAELAAVAWSTCERTVKLLKKRGQWLDADPSEDRLAQEEPLLAALATASRSASRRRRETRTGSTWRRAPERRPPLSNDRLTRTEEGK
ncbi:MAG: hypothetical protein AAB426_11495 [Myxococcota bacterium]